MPGCTRLSTLVFSSPVDGPSWADGQVLMNTTFCWNVDFEKAKDFVKAPRLFGLCSWLLLGLDCCCGFSNDSSG